MTVVEIARPKIAAPFAKTICMATVQPKPIQWLWFPRFALGKLSIIAGHPGLGKSMLTADLAARVSVGRNWADGKPCPQGSVVLVSGEDDPSDTIRPRLDAAGADVSKIHFLQYVQDVNGNRSFTLADVAALGGLLNTLQNCKLVIIDPLTAYLGSGTDSHRTSDVRALLSPLASLAAEYSAAIVTVSHLNKSQGGDALSRVTGSLAFVAAARAAFAVTRDKEEPDRRLMLPIKNNLGSDQTGMAYRIHETLGVPYIQWEKEPITISADEALAPDMGEDRSETSECMDWLKKELQSGERDAGETQREASRYGFSPKVIRRAREKLGVQSRKLDFAKGWRWYLPAQDAHVAQTHEKGTFEKKTPLETNKIHEDAQDALFESLGRATSLGHLPHMEVIDL